MTVKYLSRKKVVVTMTLNQLAAVKTALDSCADAATSVDSKNFRDVERAQDSLAWALFKTKGKNNECS